MNVRQILNVNCRLWHWCNNRNRVLQTHYIDYKFDRWRLKVNCKLWHGCDDGDTVRHYNIATTWSQQIPCSKRKAFNSQHWLVKLDWLHGTEFDWMVKSLQYNLSCNIIATLQWCSHITQPNSTLQAFMIFSKECHCLRMITFVSWWECF